MKSRKGEELVGEGLGIVLAIIGLVILGALGYGLYNLFVNQDMKNAKEFIESLSSKAEALEDGEGNTFALPGITGWVLVGWNKGSTDKPEKCFDQNCLCLCNGAGDAITCQKNGYCRNVDRSVSVSSIGEADFIGDDASTFGKFSAQCVFLEDDL